MTYHQMLQGPATLVGSKKLLIVPSSETQGQIVGVRGEADKTDGIGASRSLERAKVYKTGEPSGTYL